MLNPINVTDSLATVTTDQTRQQSVTEHKVPKTHKQTLKTHANPVELPLSDRVSTQKSTELW